MTSDSQSESGGVDSSTALLCCPSCNFDDAAYDEHVKKAAYYAGKKEGYMPKLYKDRFLNKWVIECQNCGMEIVFNSETEQEHVELWNAMPRKQHNSELSERGPLGNDCNKSDTRASLK